LYRIGLEAILGFHLRGGRLQIEPCIPPDWPGYEITYRYGSATYKVAVKKGGLRTLMVDGRAVWAADIELTDDGQQHEVQVTVAPRQREKSGRAAD
jgi:cellobiose phosphorylase